MEIPMIQPLMLLAAYAAMSGTTPSRPATATFPTVVRPVLLRSDTLSRVTPLHNKALRLAESGDLSGARSIFLTVIAYQDSVGVFPGEAQWALANLEYGRNREVRAAEILDQLADAAVRFGRPDWQARALLESGLIYQNHRYYELSAARYRALKPLLNSPALGDTLREQLLARVTGK
jgi:hypothetical protein